jgi:hypothetical protein
LTVLKIIVVCLALANIGYFLWLTDIAPPAAAPAASSGASLKLVSEVPPPHPALATAETLDDAAAAASAPLVGGDAAPAGAAPAGAVTAPVGPVTAPGSDAGTPAAVANVSRCVTVGPFKDVADAAHAASTLRAIGYDPRQRVAEGDIFAGVWVYLPLPASHPASDQLLAKLKAAGIDDSLQMPGPTDGSVISLGLFSEPKRAQARVAQVQALGLTPGVVDRKRAASLYWIDLDLKPADGPLDPSGLEGDSGHINRLEVKACTAAAS